MNDDQFTKLFKYIEDFRSETNDNFGKTASRDDLEHLKNTMDDFIARITDSETEQAARDAQWNRLIEWAPRSV